MGKDKNRLRIFEGHFGRIVMNHRSELRNSYKKEMVSISGFLIVFVWSLMLVKH